MRRKAAIGLAAFFVASLVLQGCASKEAVNGPEAKGVKQEKLALPPAANKGH